MESKSVDARRVNDKGDLSLMPCVQVDAINGGSEVLGFFTFGDTYHVTVCDLQSLYRIAV